MARDLVHGICDKLVSAMTMTESTRLLERWLVGPGDVEDWCFGDAIEYYVSRSLSSFGCSPFEFI